MAHVCAYDDSGTLGTFSSFVSFMKAKALEKNVDLLLIDSGDLHDGNGLTDGFPAGSVDAHDANKFVFILRAHKHTLAVN